MKEKKEFWILFTYRDEKNELYMPQLIIDFEDIINQNIKVDKILDNIIY